MSEGARAATTADLDTIADLVLAAAAELRAQRGGELWSLREARARTSAADLDLLLRSTGSLVLVGTFEGAEVGYALAEIEPLPDGTRLAVLSDLFVEPGARGVGVGEALMDAVVAWSEEHGCRGIDAVALPGNRETKNFFERFGLTARAILVHRPLGPWSRAGAADT